MDILDSTIEALLFASGDPLKIARISLVLEKSEDEVIEAAERLNSRYETEGHSLRVLKLGDALQIGTIPEYARDIAKVMEQRKAPSLSQPALEALAIVAYYQPVTLAYISKVRGVDSSYTVGSLYDRGLISEQGRLDVPGRPILYGTTDVFLRTMGISDISELPELPDLSSNDGIKKLQEQIEALESSQDLEITAEEPGSEENNTIEQEE